ncbi:MAG TPA: NUDIX hydrolase [Candidatus Saccharimonadales bacterium]|nr:NUDIX hydrolase [Candidatus Saccharimonadales bacterium]
MLKCEGYVLFVRHTYRDPDHWEFAGGRRKKGETPLETIIREIWEELKVKLDAGSVIDHGELLLPGRRLFLFEATVPNRKVTRESREIAHTKWFPERRPPARIGPGAREALRRARPARSRKRPKKT